MRATVLGALCVVDDGTRNEDAWTTLSQSFGFMFSQHTHGLMTPHAWLAMLLKALWGGPTQSPYSSWIDEQWWGAACWGTLFHMMPQGQGRGESWWIEMVLMKGSNRWCWPYMVVHGIGGLVVGSLCVGLGARVQGRVGLLWWLNTVCYTLG